MGVDDLGVVRHVGRLMLDDRPVPILFELVKDGDLLLLIDRMLRLRGPDTVRISKVKGHADEAMVLNGQVREVDRLGNGAADDAADFGRRRVGNAVIDARRDLSGVCGRWYPVLLDLHRFFIAISRTVVNHDGGIGTAPDPSGMVCWCSSQEASLGSCCSGSGLFCLDHLVFGILIGLIFLLLLSVLRTLHFGLIHRGLLVKWVTLSGESLHWPAGGLDLGVGGISYVELLNPL